MTRRDQVKISVVYVNVLELWTEFMEEKAGSYRLRDGRLITKSILALKY